jgi:hypothetical protein
MARQPLTRIYPKYHHFILRFGVSALSREPELAIISQIITKWSYIETEMAVVLGLLMNTDSAAMLSVFQILRRSSAQRDAVSQAASTSLEPYQQELLSALLNVHRTIEADRNDLVHGLLGQCNEIEDGVLWLQATDQMIIRLRFHLEPGFALAPEFQDELAQKTVLYRRSDLERIRDNVTELWNLWFKFMRMAQYPTASAEEFRQLCDQPRIAQELARMRQKSTP